MVARGLEHPEGLSMEACHRPEGSMVTSAAAREQLGRVRIAVRVAFGAFLVYSLIYFLAIRRSLPPATRYGDRYLRYVQAHDWRTVPNLHMSRADGTAMAAEWRRLSGDFGA